MFNILFLITKRKTYICAHYNALYLYMPYIILMVVSKNTEITVKPLYKGHPLKKPAPL